MKKFFACLFCFALYASSDESKTYLSKGSSNLDNSLSLHCEASYLLYQVQEDGLEIASNVNIVQQPNLQYAPVSPSVSFFD
jgi:hypothetical protein